MKKLLLKSSLIIFVSSTFAINSYSQTAFSPGDLYDAAQLSDMLDEKQITADQFSDYMDIIESGGDILNVT